MFVSSHDKIQLQSDFSLTVDGQIANSANYINSARVILILQKCRIPL